MDLPQGHDSHGHTHTEEDGHPHEHPQMFTPLPIVQDRLLDAIRDTLSIGKSSRNKEAREKLEELVKLISLIETAVRAAHFCTALGEKAYRLLDLSLENVASEYSIVRDKPVSGGWEQRQKEFPIEVQIDNQIDSAAALSYSTAPMIDLLIGLTYLYDNEQTRIDDTYTRVYSVFEYAIPIIDAARTAAFDSPPLDDMAAHVVEGVLLDDYKLPISQRASSFLGRLTEIKEEWLKGNPITTVLRNSRKIRLTASITSVTTEDNKVVLLSKSQTFGNQKPFNVELYGDDGRLVFPILTWNVGTVMAELPETASTGHIFFTAASGDESIEKDMHRWEEEVIPNEWLHTALPILQHLGIRRPVPIEAPVVNIIREPKFVDLSIMDAHGIHITTSEQLIEAERPLTLKWRLEHGKPNLRITLKSGDGLIGDYDAVLGQVTLPEGWDNPMRIQQLRVGISSPPADDARPDNPEQPRLGDERPVLEDRVWRVWGPLQLSPSVVRLKVGSDQDEVRADTPPARRALAIVAIEFPRPIPNPLNVMVTSDSARVIVVTQTNPMPAGTTTFVFTVTAWAYDRDHPEQPCAHISINADDERQHGSYWGELDVWVEPKGGKWEVVGDGSPSQRIPGEQLRTVGIHTALMHTGQMLFFSPPPGHINDQTNVETELWDPASRTSISLEAPTSSLRNLFCAGQCNLPDGRVLIAGGHAGIATRATDWSVHVFDPLAPSGRRWSKLSDMTEPRWYPTLTTLPDGYVLIASGSSAGPFAPIVGVDGVVHSTVGWTGDLPRLSNWLSIAFLPLVLFALSGGTATSIDLFDWRTNSLLRYPAANFLDSFADTYPYMCVLPRGPGYDHGAILAIERDRLYFFPYEPGGGRSPLGARVERRLAYAARRTFPKYGSGVLLPIHATNPTRVRYLIAGGGDERNPTLTPTAASTDTLEIIDFNPSLRLNNQRAPSLERTRRMYNRRFMSDTVLMADGNVLICGGAAHGLTNLNDTPVKQAEIFDVNTEIIHRADTAQVERRYHSTHVLLPDGTIQATGSTGGYPPQNPEPQFQVEIYRPAYLWRGHRPRIGNAPSIIRYGSAITITTPDSSRISHAALIRLASATHANTMDQRYVILPVTSVEVSSPSRPTDHIMVSAPRDGTIAPPGPYMLLLIDRLGVPSRAQIVFVQ